MPELERQMKAKLKVEGSPERKAVQTTKQAVEIVPTTALDAVSAEKQEAHYREQQEKNGGVPMLRCYTELWRSFRVPEAEATDEFIREQAADLKDRGTPIVEAAWSHVMRNPIGVWVDDRQEIVGQVLRTGGMALFVVKVRHKMLAGPGRMANDFDLNGRPFHVHEVAIKDAILEAAEAMRFEIVDAFVGRAEPVVAYKSQFRARSRMGESWTPDFIATCEYKNEWMGDWFVVADFEDIGVGDVVGEHADRIFAEIKPLIAPPLDDGKPLGPFAQRLTNLLQDAPAWLRDPILTAAALPEADRQPLLQADKVIEQRLKDVPTKYREAVRKRVIVSAIQRWKELSGCSE